MSVDSNNQISATSQAVANQALEEYLAKKKIIADELVDKEANVQVSKDAKDAKDNIKMENEKFQDAKQLKSKQVELYQIRKETDKLAMEEKYAKSDAVATADASRFQTAKVSLRAAQNKDRATIDQNTVALEDVLAAKTSTAEANRRADNATALEMAHSNSIYSKAGTEQAIEAYHDNMAEQNRLQSANIVGTAQPSGAEILTNSPHPHINVMD